MQSLDYCFKVWEHQDHEGFVFLSSKHRDGSWHDHGFQWPADKEEIATRFSELDRKSADIYWCPLIFDRNHRRKEYVKGPRVLYADLDPINPKDVDFEPTLAWASSPKRFQAVWLLKKTMELAAWEKLNQGLTYSCGADKGGWDATQVLRVPGTRNFKYSDHPKGRILWWRPKNTYAPKEITVPEQSPQTSATPLGSSKTLIELLSQYRPSIPPKISRLLQYPDSRIDVGHRSDMLWSIENELVQAKIPIEDIIAIVQQSAWNKYRGRADEWTRLKTEITRVYEGRVRVKTIEEVEVSTHLKWETYLDVMAAPSSTPGWLIRDVWMKGSHGIVAGEPKTFKSTVSLDIAVSVASGVPLWGSYPVETRGPVMMIQNENARWIIKDRLEKIISCKGLVGKVEKDIIDPKCLFVDFPPELPIVFLNNFEYTFSDPLHKEELEKAIENVRPVLLVLDPLYLMFEGDLNSAQDLQPVFAWLLHLKETYNLSIMLVHHWNKNGSSGRGGQRMLGSTTLHGWVESALYLQSNTDYDNDKIAKVLIEREFRAAGIMPKLELSLAMGDFGCPQYDVKLDEAKAAIKLTDLLDLLSLNPGGISLNKLSKALGGLSKRALKNMLKEGENELEIVSKGQMKLVKLKGA